MATVTEKVKESLLGTEQPENLSQESRLNFTRHARKDTDEGELYMSEEDFINAIAPPQEDYVRNQSPFLHARSLTRSLCSTKSRENSMEFFSPSQIGRSAAG